MGCWRYKITCLDMNLASTTFFDLTGKSTQKPWKYITIRKIKTVPSRHDNFPRNSGIPAGTAPFGACDRGKIPRRDGDKDEDYAPRPAGSPYLRVYRILLIYPHNL